MGGVLDRRHHRHRLHQQPAEPAATQEDVDYILAAANRALVRPLIRADVIAVYAGLRPLVEAVGEVNGSKGAKPTTKVSREHVVDVPVPGLASIAGGKFTTYRVMARDVVDTAVADFGREVPGSVKNKLPLLGADGLVGVQAGAGRLAEDYRVSRPAVEHLIDRYGTLTGSEKRQERRTRLCVSGLHRSNPASTGWANSPEDWRRKRPPGRAGIARRRGCRGRRAPHPVRPSTEADVRPPSLPPLTEPNMRTLLTSTAAAGAWR